MNLSQLYYFRKLAELQHYTRAAKELFLSLSEAEQGILQQRIYDIHSERDIRHYLQLAKSLR